MERDKACLMAVGMAAAITALQGLLPLFVWPPLQFSVLGVLSRDAALSLLPPWPRGALGIWLGVVWSWRGIVLLFLLNTSAVAAAFLFAVARFARAEAEEGRDG